MQAATKRLKVDINFSNTEVRFEQKILAFHESSRILGDRMAREKILLTDDIIEVFEAAKPIFQEARSVVIEGKNRFLLGKHEEEEYPLLDEEDEAYRRTTLIKSILSDLEKNASIKDTIERLEDLRKAIEKEFKSMLA